MASETISVELTEALSHRPERGAANSFEPSPRYCPIFANNLFLLLRMFRTLPKAYGVARFRIAK
jgi:hypothetical protein